jgi:hypothetical protein
LKESDFGFEISKTGTIFQTILFEWILHLMTENKIRERVELEFADAGLVRDLFGELNCNLKRIAKLPARRSRPGAPLFPLTATPLPRILPGTSSASSTVSSETAIRSIPGMWNMPPVF